ncbi:MAG: DUF3576 domain-containing protein [Rhodobacteraceae bacterium]|nr:DUF3576 domain-containing protein [Paracoccaceae bacterium]
MIRAHYTKAVLSAVLLLSLSACGWFGGNRTGASTPSADQLAMRQRADAQRAALARASGEDDKRNTIFGLFANSANPNTTVEVNKYLWKASLEVLDFLPIESVDPFTGVIVTGYGTPPGSGRAYRATIYVQDPALDARSLKISLQTKGGAPVDAETARAVEDAIMTRARQLRIADSKL